MPTAELPSTVTALWQSIDGMLHVLLPKLRVSWRGARNYLLAVLLAAVPAHVTDVGKILPAVWTGNAGRAFADRYQTYAFPGLGCCSKNEAYPMHAGTGQPIFCARGRPKVGTAGLSVAERLD